MAVADLIRHAEEKGIRDYGLTDHVHTSFNLPDLEASRKEFDGSQPSPRFHFGVEASCVSQWEIDEIESGRYRGDPPVYGIRQGGPAGASLAIMVTQALIDRLRIEYVIGGTHWAMYVPLERQAIIREFHRQNMFLATHPLVNIVAHPWWWHGHWQGPDGRYSAEPWLDDFNHVPRTMHDEFASAVIQHGKKVEVNLEAHLLQRSYPDKFKRQYMEYLVDLQERGVALTIGSDCHSAQYETDFDAAAALIDGANIADERLWRLPPRGQGA
jgi:histidinol phosphatase-like PHP family hydrolase